MESGYEKQARDDADAALKLAPNRDVRAMAALALARAGDTARAEKLAAELDKTFPLDTLVQRYWLPTIRAAVALEHKDPNRAVELLKVASTIELGQPAQVNIFLCPVYLRGEAYLMLHDGNAAAAEFQKFIDHYGLVVNFPWGALARLGLARAYSLSGDNMPAKGRPTRTSSTSGKTPIPTSRLQTSQSRVHHPAVSSRDRRTVIALRKSIEGLATCCFMRIKGRNPTNWVSGSTKWLTLGGTLHSFPDCIVSASKTHNRGHLMIPQTWLDSAQAKSRD